MSECSSLVSCESVVQHSSPLDMVSSIPWVKSIGSVAESIVCIVKCEANGFLHWSSYKIDWYTEDPPQRWEIKLTEFFVKVDAKGSVNMVFSPSWS